MRPGHPGRAAGFYDGWWLKEQNHVMDTSFFESSLGARLALTAHRNGLCGPSAARVRLNAVDNVN